MVSTVGKDSDIIAGTRVEFLMLSVDGDLPAYVTLDSCALYVSNCIIV
jgi:hypothetical protein